MAVSLRGYTQGAFSAIGTFSVAWPAGTAVGDMAVFMAATGSDKKPATVFPSGWQQKGVKSDGTSLWWKILTAGDIASALPIKARLELGAVLTGAAGVGALGSGESLKIAAGGALLLGGWKATADDLTSGKIHATDVVNESYVTKGIPRRYNLWLAPMPSAGTAYIDTNANAFFAVEILPQVVPYAPTPLAPPDGYFSDTAAPIEFRWRHNPATGAGIQQGFRLRLTRGVDTWYVTDTEGSGWSTTPTTQPQPDGKWLASMGTFTAGSYQWQVATTENGTDFGPYCAVQGLTIKAKPTLTASTSGSGRARTVSWTPTITNGSQTWYRVRVCPAADTNPGAPLWDSGIIAGADTSLAVPPTISWVNSASYKAWVEVGQTGGQQTVPTASSSFTVSWTPPTAPSSVAINTAVRPATLTVNGVSGKQQVRVAFGAGDLTHEIFAAVAGASVTIALPLAPYGIATVYTVTASQIVSGVELWSSPVTATQTITDPTPYLVDGLDWVGVDVWADSERADTEGVLAAFTLGGSRPVVIRTPSQGQTGKTSLRVRTRAQLDTLTAWLENHPSFILRWAPERAGSTLADVPATRMSRVTPTAEDRVAQVLLQSRILTFEWVEQ